MKTYVAAAAIAIGVMAPLQSEAASRNPHPELATSVISDREISDLTKIEGDMDQGSIDIRNVERGIVASSDNAASCLDDLASVLSATSPYLESVGDQLLLSTAMAYRIDQRTTLSMARSTADETRKMIVSQRRLANWALGACSESQVVQTKGAAVLALLSYADAKLAAVIEKLDADAHSH